MTEPGSTSRSATRQFYFCRSTRFARVAEFGYIDPVFKSGTAIRARALRLSDGSRGTCVQAGRLPEVRHGPGAGYRRCAGNTRRIRLPDASGDRKGRSPAPARTAAWLYNRGR